MKALAIEVDCLNTFVLIWGFVLVHDIEIALLLIRQIFFKQIIGVMIDYRGVVRLDRNVGVHHHCVNSFGRIQ
ncbi:hypothetical protein D3C81_1739080 [compost metagenome]